MILSYKTKFPWGAPTHFKEKIIAGVKIHTIRRDTHSRWKAGRPIHHATGVRTPEYNCFAEGVCSGVQEIKIRPECRDVIVYRWVEIIYRGYLLSEETIKKLTINDGFDSVEDFWRWFDKPFTGEILHFTNFRY